MSFCVLGVGQGEIHPLVGLGEFNRKTFEVSQVLLARF